MIKPRVKTSKEKDVVGTFKAARGGGVKHPSPSKNGALCSIQTLLNILLMIKLWSSEINGFAIMMMITAPRYNEIMVFNLFYFFFVIFSEFYILI